MIWDVAVAGGGPAGLAFATRAARHGMKVLVLERDVLPRDKACGEGLLPAGVAELNALGARLSPKDATAFTHLRYVQEDGTSLDAELPPPGGLGVRRVALSKALLDLATEAGVTVCSRERVEGFTEDAAGVRLTTSHRTIDAELLVAADGLHSTFRRALNPSDTAPTVRRFGLRRHLRAEAPPRVEVHFAEGVEAYLTPVGDGRIGVAFLWEPAAIEPRATFDLLLSRFPALKARFDRAPFESEAMGAGPLLQPASTLSRGRVVLLGDAAGYVDALTGEGLSLGLHGARVLADALRAADPQHALATYAREHASAFSRYARLTHALLSLARRPRMRRAALRALAASPSTFARLVRAALPAPADLERTA